MGKQHGTKKGTKICLFIFFALIIGAAVFFFSTAKDEKAADEYFSMSTNAERVGFLNEQGWIVKPDPLSREEITIPTEFNELYQKYAQLQSEQGFDLEKYKGKKATLFSYRILNYPEHTENITANMLVCDDRLVAGDISLNEEDGFTRALLSSTAQAMLYTDSES